MSVFISKPSCNHRDYAPGKCPGCNHVVREARINCTNCDGDIPCERHRPEGWIDWREEEKRLSEAMEKRLAEYAENQFFAYLASVGWRETK